MSDVRIDLEGACRSACVGPRQLAPIACVAASVVAACTPTNDAPPDVASARSTSTQTTRSPAAVHASGAPGASSAFAETHLFDFVPEIAEIVAKQLSRDREFIGVILALQDRDAGRCGDTTTRSMQFRLPGWTGGMKVDLAGLARSKLSADYRENASSAGTWVMKLERTPEASADSRIHPEIPWDPTGTIDVMEPHGSRTPTEVHVRLKNGAFEFDKVLPARVCVPPE